jgi:hypothetical protein
MILKKSAPPESSASDAANSPTQPRSSGRVIIWMGSSKEDISALPMIQVRLQSARALDRED